MAFSIEVKNNSVIATFTTRKGTFVGRVVKNKAGYFVNKIACNYDISEAKLKQLQSRLAEKYYYQYAGRFDDVLNKNAT